MQNDFRLIRNKVIKVAEPKGDYQLFYRPPIVSIIKFCLNILIYDLLDANRLSSVYRPSSCKYN